MYLYQNAVMYFNINPEYNKMKQHKFV